MNIDNLKDVVTLKNGKKFNVTTLTQATVNISRELYDLLKTEFDYEFNYISCESCVTDMETILEDEDELKRMVEEYSLSNDDIHDVKDIIELHDKVNIVVLEIAL